MELHNIFNMRKDRSGRELESLIKTSKDGDRTELYETALELYHRYGWAVCRSLARLLERI
jgi:hypothetical protein